MATEKTKASKLGFHGRYTEFAGYDESEFALLAAENAGTKLECIDITSDDFKNNIDRIIYHLIFP